VVDIEINLSRVYSAGGTWGIDGMLHSIEPRVQYLWINGYGKTNLPVWTEGLDQIPNTSLVSFSLTNRIRARTAAQPDTEPVRWELLRFAAGGLYDVRAQEFGSAFGTLIVQPSVNRLRLRGDLLHSVQGKGVELASSDISVKLDPLLPASVSVGS